MQSYSEEFQTALEFSKERGIFSADYQSNTTTYIAEWLMYELGPKIAEYFTQDSFTRFMGGAQNSVRLHHLFKPVIDELLKVDSVVTTGYVRVPNDANEIEEFGKMTQADAALALKSAEAPEKIHTWITLPSGEIIDIAFMTLYGILYNEESLIGNIVAKHPKDLTGGMEYHPIFIGEGFYEKCGFDFNIDFARYEEEPEEGL